MPGIPLAGIEDDFAAGAGREMEGKLCAAHSSAALVLNTFGPWRENPTSLPVAGLTGFRALRFEVTFPTGLGGTPPYLDVVADGNEIVAVESKCTEWMACKAAKFARSYDQLRPSHGHSPWFEQMQLLRAKPYEYQFLDAAQLVKHAFGLLTRFGRRDIRLVYLYWEPLNSQAWPECILHRAEADRLADYVGASNVRLVPMSYRELWAEWERRSPPTHLPYLKRRYGQDV